MRLTRWLSVLYPRTWRDRYFQEMDDLTGELLAAGKTTRARVAAGLVRSGLLERVRSLHNRPRLTVIGAGITLAAMVGGGIVVSNALGGGPSPPAVAASTSSVIPANANPIGVPLHDLVGTVVVSNRVVGYVPDGGVLLRVRSALPAAQLSSPVATKIQTAVYAANFKTLVGHVYFGIGFVPVDEVPQQGSCTEELVVVGGRSPIGKPEQFSFNPCFTWPIR